MDELLAQHIAHLFIRDPVVLHAEKVEEEGEADIDHFLVNFMSGIASCLPMTRFSLAMLRISTQETGRACVSSHLFPTLASGGVLSSGLLKSNSPTLKTLPSLFLWFC